MAFRNDQEALQFRSASLERSLTEIRSRLRAIDREAPSLRAAEQTTQAELAQAQRALADIARGQSAAETLLGKVKVATPCPADWANMVGDERARFCGSCQKNVYNISAMTAVEAADLLRSREGNMCVRLYRRADGTIITSDCPVGVRRRRMRNSALLAGGLALATAIGHRLLSASSTEAPTASPENGEAASSATITMAPKETRREGAAPEGEYRMGRYQMTQEHPEKSQGLMMLEE